MWKFQTYLRQNINNHMLNGLVLSSASKEGKNWSISGLFKINESKRRLCTTICRNQDKAKLNLHRDVYKEIGYKSPFTDIEKILILKTINETKSEKQLHEFAAKTNAATLFEHLNTYGDFKIVEELLAVKKFDEKILERLCRRIIKSQEKQDDESDSINESSTDVQSIQPKISKYLRPRLTKEAYASDSIESIVSIKISLYDVSYTHMEKQTKRILSWNSFNCFDNKGSTGHPRLFETATQIVNQIPPADIFIIEEQLPIMKGNNNSNLKANGT